MAYNRTDRLGLSTFNCLYIDNYFGNLIFKNLRRKQDDMVRSDGSEGMGKGQGCF